MILCLYFTNIILHLHKLLYHTTNQKDFLQKKEHIICSCNICQNAEIDPHTKASYIKKREILRGLTRGVNKT